MCSAFPLVYSPNKAVGTQAGGDKTLGFRSLGADDVGLTPSFCTLIGDWSNLGMLVILFLKSDYSVYCCTLCLAEKSIAALQ